MIPLLGWNVAFALLSVGSVLVKFVLKDQHASAGMINLLKGWPSFAHFPMFYLFLSLSLIYIGHWLAIVMQGKPLTGKTRQMLWIGFVMLCFAGMWFGLFLNFYAVSPRYRVNAYPFMVFGLVYGVAIFFRRPLLLQGILIAMLAVSLICSYGFFLGGEDKTHVMLERSLEYRSDLKLNQKIADLFQRGEYRNFTIGAPFTLAQMLAFPRLGYVRMPLKVMIYGFPCLYGNIENFRGIEHTNIGQTLYLTKREEADMPPGFPVGEDDRIVGEVQFGAKKAWLFMGGFAIDRTWKVIRLLRYSKKKQL